MSPEEKYIRKLEHRIWLLETSKSYRLTSPLRKAEEVANSLIRLPGALMKYVKPGFRTGFDARTYLASSMRPHGWWRKFPALHYCLFNSRENEDDGKYDVLDRGKPVVVLVSHTVCRTGAPILVLDLVKRFAETHNVVVFSIGGGALENTFREKAAVFVGPIARANLGFVLDRELTQLKRRATPEFAIVNSIEATEVLDELWRHDVPVLHLVHEFAAYTRPRKRFEKSASLSHAMVFSAGIVRDNAMAACPDVRKLDRIVLPQGLCALPENPMGEEEKEREREEIRLAFRPKNWPGDTVVVLGAGTVQLRKGLDLFISCAKKVLAKNPAKRIRFVWIGSGYNPENDLNFSCFIDEQIKASGLGDSFALLNEVRELQAAYDAADIFFLSSKLDPLPLVAQDALFNRLPLVCFDGASGIPGHIRSDPDASSGIVPYLDVEAAAEKIIRFASDGELRKKTGDAGRRLAERIFNQDEYFSTLNRIGHQASGAMRQELADREVIRESGCFDVNFTYPRLVEEEDLALKYYTTSWRTGLHRRKPFPGFHPGIYADHHPDISRDPLAHFLESGKPAGPWLSEVISSESSRNPDPRTAAPKVALHIHLHYTDVAGEIFSRLQTCGIRPDLFITVTGEQGKREVEALLGGAGLNPAMLKIVPNRGRDIGPLFTAFPELFASGYEFIGHVHGKKSVKLGADFAREWAAFLYENLLGSRHPMLEAILGKMQADPGIGFVFPDDPHIVGWEENWPHAQEMAEAMGLAGALRGGSINFPVGTMFWARSRALEPFLKLNLQWEDYPEEPLPYDGSVLHAMERLLPQVCESQGLRTAVTHAKGVAR